ncbi:ABC transporter permease subunit [Arsenicicoccus dermatophilus]|uniref:ABC transporter permease subunit n=1 Tax=Arsenicicoccus dermatophilus TaxID=1076331 RepID=UPI00391758B5
MNPVVLRLAFSSLLGRARLLPLLALPTVLLLLTGLARYVLGADASADDPAGRAVLGTLGLVVVVPMLALLTATRLLGTEMEDGTIYYLLSKPVPRRQVVVSKLLAGATTTLVLGALPLGLAALLLDPGSPVKALGWAAGGAAAAVAYCGLFTALSASTRHAVVWGLLYLTVWEGGLRNLLSGIEKVSVGAWATRVASEVGRMSVIAPAEVGPTHALVGLLLVLVGGTAFAAYRLSGLSITAAEA